MIADDTDVIYDAMNKALVTQTKYETLDTYRQQDLKAKDDEIGSLKWSNFVKDILIVTLAIVRINLGP